MTKNNLFKYFAVVIFSVMVVGCTQKPDSNDDVGYGLDENVDDTSLEDKNQEITLTGKISKSGNLYLITTASGKIQDLESYTVKFDKYLGKTVTVVGEFSGDTLFVTELR